jgi:2-polyprenyl-3-methyl-5-hydroxy-6-metoxy-1,4-benzoquinol methylase
MQFPPLLLARPRKPALTKPQLRSQCEADDTDRRRDLVRAIVRSQQPFAARCYARIRLRILRPLLESVLLRHLPRRGLVLDLGCGTGLLALFLAMTEPRRQVYGIDVNRGRIALARRAARRLGVGNVTFTAADLRDWSGPDGFDGASLIDVIHHLPAADVPRFLAGVRDRLRPGAPLLIKEVLPTPRWKMLFTLALDRLMVGAEPIRYWPADELTGLLRGLGFTVSVRRLDDVIPFPHVVYVCRWGRKV